MLRIQNIIKGPLRQALLPNLHGCASCRFIIIQYCPFQNSSIHCSPCLTDHNNLNVACWNLYKPESSQLQYADIVTTRIGAYQQQVCHEWRDRECSLRVRKTSQARMARRQWELRIGEARRRNRKDSHPLRLGHDILDRGERYDTPWKTCVSTWAKSITNRAKTHTIRKEQLICRAPPRPRQSCMKPFPASRVQMCCSRV